MPPAVTGGKPKKSKKSAKKSGSKKAPKKKTTSKKSGSKKKGPTLEQVKKQAKKAHIPLSKKGKAKTKAQLQAALRARK